MSRVTVSRSAARAEAERAAAAVPPAVVVPAQPSANNSGRWTARVLVVPAVFAEALARLSAMANRPAPVGPDRHSSHRSRGVYIWRSTDAPGEEMPGAEELLPMPDVGTAENEIARLKGKLH